MSNVAVAQQTYGGEVLRCHKKFTLRVERYRRITHDAAGRGRIIAHTVLAGDVGASLNLDCVQLFLQAVRPSKFMENS